MLSDTSFQFMAHDELLPMTMIMINNGIVIMNHKAIIMTFGKIDPMSLGVSLGILSGVSTIFMGLILLIFNTGKPFNGTMGALYITYDFTLLQCLLGGAAVAVSTFIGSYIIAWIYNLLRNKLNS